MQAAFDWQTALQKDNPWFYSATILYEPFCPGALISDDTKSTWPHSSPTMHVVLVGIMQPDAEPGHAEGNAEHLRACVKAMENAAGGAVLNKYPTYALVGTPAEAFYRKNLKKPQKIKKRLDPHNRFNKGITII